MDEIFSEFSVPAQVESLIRKVVEEKSGKKDKEFFRTLIAIQRDIPLTGEFYVKLLGSIIKVRKTKGKAVPKKSSLGLKVDKVARNSDGSFTVTITLPAEVFNLVDPVVEEPVKVEEEIKPVPEPVKAPASIMDALKPKYMAAISGTDVDTKTFWDQVLYHSLDKGLVRLDSIAAKTGKPKELVRTYLQNRYNSDVVSVEFSDGEDTVNVTWAISENGAGKK